MRTKWLAAILVMGVACLGGRAGAQQAPTAASVKAAYIYKFLPYAEWPASALPAEAAFVIGMAGADRIDDELAALVAGRKLGGRPLEVRVLQDGDPAEGLHVVFAGQRQTLARWVERVRGKPVLIISDVAQSVEQGSMLGLVTVDGKVRFEAAPGTAERAGLRLSARLLTLADKVVTR